MDTVSVAAQADASFEAITTYHPESGPRFKARFWEGSAETFRELAASWDELAMNGPCSAPFFQSKWFKCLAGLSNHMRVLCL
jgi:hypothetical protein